VLKTKKIVDGLIASSKEIHFLNENNIEVNYYFEKGIEIICQFSIEKKSYEYNFTFSSDYLARYENHFEQSFELYANTQKKYHAQSSVCCKLNTVFESLFHNKLDGMMNAIFMESMASQILVETHSEKIEDFQLPCYSCKFLNNPTEKQKILQARVIMLINIAEPLSIPQLAKAVHINECYLKKGFKEMFGYSIFDYIQQERIKKAKLMLVQQNVSINDIAIELGYSNTSNFTNAFKKNTGFAPSEWQRNN
jgi:AraC-like DNA-binding protein